jgi:hypothetical protein
LNARVGSRPSTSVISKSLVFHLPYERFVLHLV